MKKAVPVSCLPNGTKFVFLHDQKEELHRKLKVKNVTDCATYISGEKFLKDPYDEKLSRWVSLGDNYCIANSSEVIPYDWRRKI